MIRINIFGGQRIRAALASGAALGPSAAERALYAGGQRIFSDSQRRTPVDTGALRGSGTTTQGGDVFTITYGGAAAGYAIYVHEGTYRMGARPFLRDAITAGGAQLIADVNDAVGGAFG